MKLLPFSLYLPKIGDFVEIFSIGCEQVEDKFLLRIACRNGSGEVILITPEELTELSQKHLVPF
jgi:hypothetical protein